MKLKPSTVVAAAAIAAASGVAAGPLHIAGELSASDPVYQRALAERAPASTGASVHYDVFRFQVDVAAAYRMQMLAAAFGDNTVITLYGAGFDPSSPAAGALAVDDDSGAGLLSLIDGIALDAFTTYNLVVTSFGQGQVGNYEGRIAPLDVGNVFAVPAPTGASLAVLALALLAATRRRRA